MVFSVSFKPFILLTTNLIIVPTPIAIEVSKYRVLYTDVHANAAFCEMGFGPHFKARRWSDEETREVIQTRDVERCWKKRGDGGREMGGEGQQVMIVEKNEYENLIGTDRELLDAVQWMGYAGVRDATTTSMPEQVPGDPELPPWLEVIELRYGVAPEYWGKEAAKGAAEAVMQWAVSEKGVKRFIAETERENMRSGKVLEKLGFRLSRTDYWREPSEVEWERTP